MTKVEIIKTKVERSLYENGTAILDWSDSKWLIEQAEDTERLRGNLRTIEVMTTCADTKDFAKRALSGDATIEI